IAAQSCHPMRHGRASPGWFDSSVSLRYDTAMRYRAGPRALRPAAFREDLMETVQNEVQQAFTAKMQAKHITPLWTIANRVVMREPTPKTPSVFWNYQRDIRPYILEAADIITAAEAHRRVLVLNNPALKHGATHTLTCAIQAIKGGEIAPAHRHSQ